MAEEDINEYEVLGPPRSVAYIDDERVVLRLICSSTRVDGPGVVTVSKERPWGNIIETPLRHPGRSEIMGTAGNT
jgi:hypothetical protein